MAKRTPEEIKKDYDAALKVVDEVAYDALQKIARKYGLSIKQKPPKGRETTGWAINIEGDDRDYRSGFSVTVGEFEKPGSAYLWYLVDNLKTGESRSITQHVPIAKLAPALTKAVKDFEKRLIANENLDPKETWKKKMGVKFYWDFDRVDDDFYEYSTDFGGTEYMGYIVGERGDWEGSLTDADGKHLLAEEYNNDASALMKKIEKMFLEVTKPGQSK